MDIRCGECSQFLITHTCYGIEQNKCKMKISLDKYCSITKKAIPRNAYDIPLYDSNNLYEDENKPKIKMILLKTKVFCKVEINGVKCNKAAWRGGFCYRHGIDPTFPITASSLGPGKHDKSNILTKAKKEIYRKAKGI